MKKIKHNNILKPNPGLNQPEFNYFTFICRGCMMHERDIKWNNFMSSIGQDYNRNIDNSYLTFEEEPDNRNDPDAIGVLCRGEEFGTMGYVGREFTGQIKEILNKCKFYRIDMVDESRGVSRETELIVTWH